MRLPRLTTRRLMVLVAVAAALIGGAEATHRRYERAMSLHHSYSRMAGHLALALVRDRAAGRRVSTGDQRAVEQWAAMARYYRRAAWLPWLPVPADPPSPE